jgi:hypothetical protein
MPAISSKIPDCMRFVNPEEFTKLRNVLMRIIPAEKTFQQFGEQFKARAETMKVLAAASEEWKLLQVGSSGETL